MMIKAYCLLFLFIAALFVIKLSPIFGQPLAETHIRYNDVRGAAVEKDGLLYTLSFEEQKELIKNLNQNKPVKNKTIIYLFERPDLVFQP